MNRINYVGLTGKVMRTYEDRGSMYITLSVTHEHCTEGHRDIVESFFRLIVNDSQMIAALRPLKRGGRIRVGGHLKLDYIITSGGNRKDRVHIYADEIEVIE